MSRFSTMPRAYRRQLQAQDEQAVDRATRTPPDITTGSAGRLRGIPAVARGVPGVIRGTNPLAALLEKERHV